MVADPGFGYVQVSSELPGVEILTVVDRLALPLNGDGRDDALIDPGAEFWTVP